MTTTGPANNSPASLRQIITDSKTWNKAQAKARYIEVKNLFQGATGDLKKELGQELKFFKGVLGADENNNLTTFDKAAKIGGTWGRSGSLLGIDDIIILTTPGGNKSKLISQDELAAYNLNDKAGFILLPDIKVGEIGLDYQGIKFSAK